MRDRAGVHRLFNCCRPGSAMVASILLLLTVSPAVAQPVSPVVQPPQAPATAPPRGPTLQNRFCYPPGSQCCDECIGDDYYGRFSPYYEENVNTCSDSGLCLACGQGGERCCPGGKCNIRQRCNSGGFCEAFCGEAGLPCCTGEDNFRDDGCANPGITCVSGTCMACGERGMPCCADQSQECFNNGQCDAATNTCGPAECGVAGRPCCPGDRLPLGNGASLILVDGCEYEAVCVDGACSPCGFQGTPCCPGGIYECFGDAYYYFGYTLGECSDEGICRGGPSLPPPTAGPPPATLPESGRECGFLGLRCCTPEEAEIFGGDCPGDTQVCTDGICTSCGVDGAECCEGGSCFTGDTFCDADGFCSSDCGVVGGRCCDDGVCGFKRACDTETNTCVPLACGARGQQCCAVSPASPSEDACDFGLDCVNGTCRSCGFEGDPCCEVERFFGFGSNDRPGPDKCFGDGAVCGPDNTCTGALPFQVPGCGFAISSELISCCPGDRCARGNTCEDGRCVFCGTPGEQCCPGGRCEGGGACVDGVCGAKTCGEPGLACCDIDPAVDLFACSGNSACVDDTCEFCGYYGAPCCDENPKLCFGQGECRGGTCFSTAGASPAPLPPPAQAPPAAASPPTSPQLPPLPMHPPPQAAPQPAPSPRPATSPAPAPPPVFPPAATPDSFNVTVNSQGMKPNPGVLGLVPTAARSMRSRRPRGQRQRMRRASNQG